MTRREQIVKMLKDRELCDCEIAVHFDENGEIDQATITRNIEFEEE